MAVILGGPGIYLGGASAPPAPSYSEYSMKFENNGYLDLGTRTQNFTSFTLSFWVKYNGGNGKVIIGSEDNNGGILNQIYISAGFVRYASQITNLTNALNIGQWYHVAIVYKSLDNTLKSYQDGVLIADINPTAGTTNAHSFRYIGAKTVLGAPTGKFEGLLDEVAIYNVIFSESEVNSDLYNNGVPKDLNTNKEIPIHWWRMGDGDTWSGSFWDVLDNGDDGGFGIDARSVNMVEADRVTDVP